MVVSNENKLLFSINVNVFVSWLGYFVGHFLGEKPPKFNDAKDLVRFMFEQTYNDVIGGIDIPFGIMIHHKNDFSELTKACDSFLFDKEATRKVIVNGTSHYPVDGITPLILAIMSGMNKKKSTMASI